MQRTATVGGLWMLGGVLALLLGGAPPAAADTAMRLRGVWLGEARAAGGAPAALSMEVAPAPGGAGLDVRGWREGPAGRAAWGGLGRVEGADLVVEARPSPGIAGALGGAGGGAPLRGRWTLTPGGALVGGWTAPGAATEVLHQRPALAPSLPQGELHWARGGFVEGADRCPMLHANDPEVITSIDGDRVIAASTLSPAGRAEPRAHLDHAFQGRFRIFASNQNRAGRALHQVIVLFAPGDAPARVRIHALASAATGEAPYRDFQLPDEVIERDPVRPRPSGPGDAAASAALRGWRPSDAGALGWADRAEGVRSNPARARSGSPSTPDEVVVPPRRAVALLVRPVLPRQERMTHADLVAEAPVQAAVLYLPAAPDAAALERALRAGRLLPRGPEDREPSPPGATSGALIFGRVAGVVAASTWSGTLANDADGRALLATPGTWRFGWNALRGAEAERMAGPMLARNPSSAYRAWGSYGAELRLAAPLENPTATAQRVAVYLDSLAAPAAPRAFRGTFEVVVEDGRAARPPSAWVHVLQRSGARGATPLVDVVVPPGARRVVRLRTIFSANNQAPHALRVEVTPAP